MSDWYILVNKKPVKVDIVKAGLWMREGHSIIAQTRFFGILVSTVFLCLDHAWHDDPGPILYETMVFHLKEEEYQARYRTRREAIIGHWKTVARTLWNLMLRKLKTI